MKPFVPKEKKAPGERGDGIVTAYREDSLTRMLELHKYVDDRRRGSQTSAIDRLMCLKTKAEQQGNPLAAEIADEAIEYLRDVLDEVAQCATDFAQIRLQQ